MKHTEQTVGTAIGELNCIRPDTPASLDELHALSIARDCIDELLRSCVKQMRSDPEATQTWSAIAHTLGLDSANAVRQRFGDQPVFYDDDHVALFWATHADQFTWDFLPNPFLYELYRVWFLSNLKQDPPVSRPTFAHLVRGVATASGDWVHTRCRPRALMGAREPLIDRIPDWIPLTSDRARYGLRRSGVTSHDVPEDDDL